jgi:hypothetical protein
LSSKLPEGYLIQLGKRLEYIGNNFHQSMRIT